MFAQESLMDIKKLRQEFEKHASKFFKTNEAFEDDGENYVYDEVKFMWDCWLAAKAQAVPEGFVLVPKEPTDIEIESIKEKHWDMRGCQLCKSDYIDLYKAMIEPQEPTND